MGRSFSGIGSKNRRPNHPGKSTRRFPLQALLSRRVDSYFAMIQRDGKTYQRRWQLDYQRQRIQRRRKIGRLRPRLRQSRPHLSSPDFAQRPPAAPPRLVLRKRGTWNMLPRLRSRRLSRLRAPRPLRVHLLPQRLPEDPKSQRRGGFRTGLPAPSPTASTASAVMDPARTTSIPSPNQAQRRQKSAPPS